MLKDYAIFLAVIFVLAVILWAGQHALDFVVTHVPRKAQLAIVIWVVVGAAAYAGYRQRSRRE